MAPPPRPSRRVRARAAAQPAAQSAAPSAARRAFPDVPSAVSNAPTNGGIESDKQAHASEGLDDPRTPAPPPNRRGVRRRDRQTNNDLGDLSALKPSILPARAPPPADPSRFNFPPLDEDGSNFTVWRFHVRTALRISKIDKVLSIPCPDQVLDPAGFDTWRRMDREAYNIISFYLTDGPARIVMLATTAKDCLDKLAVAYEEKLSSLIVKIFRTPMTDTEPLGPQIDAIIEASHRAAEIGSPLHEAHIASAIMAALPSSFETLKIILDSVSLVDYTPEFVKARILSCEQLRIHASGDTPAEFYAKISKKEKKKISDAKRKKKKKCTHCNRAGHDVKDCRKLKNEQDKSAGTAATTS